MKESDVVEVAGYQLPSIVRSTYLIGPSEKFRLRETSNARGIRQFMLISQPHNREKGLVRADLLPPDIVAAYDTQAVEG